MSTAKWHETHSIPNKSDIKQTEDIWPPTQLLYKSANAFVTIQKEAEATAPRYTDTP